MKNDVSPTKELVEYVMSTAGKVLLTLVSIEHIKGLVLLHKEGFTDADLPIRRVKISGIQNVGSWDESTKTMRPKRWKCFTKLGSVKVDLFVNAQWKFLAPTFGGEHFDRVFHISRPLPFVALDDDIRRLGHFSQVLKVGVHPAHADSNTFRKAGANMSQIAVKKFNPGHDDDFHKELATLRVIRELDHDHLLKPIAAFDNGNHQCFIFPWAEGGNLRDYWERADSNSNGRLIRDDDEVTWTLRQMRALADCLRLLWNENCRHGDLKPENILLFMNDNTRGNFVIADVGLSKFHTAVTARRKQSSSVKFATRRYGAPEMYMEDRHEPLSRDFDIWSMGVILLEWLTWLIYGNEKLQEYRGVEKLWESSTRGNVLLPRAQKWITEIKENLVKETALKDIIEIVETRLLIFELAKEVESPLVGRAKAAWLSERMDEIYARAKRESSYRYDLQIWQRIGNSTQLNIPQRPVTRRLALSDSGVGGTELKTSDSVPSITIESTDGSIARTSAVVADEYNELHRRNLDDVWETEPDNEFAREFFNENDRAILPPVSPQPVLCTLCRQYAMNVWVPQFDINYEMTTMEERGRNCALCKLLHQSLLDSGIHTHCSGKLFRVGSAFKLDPKGPPIISIYVDPGEVSVPCAQFGLPQLPRPVSGVQISLLRQWLRTCDQSHRCLDPSKPQMPTRLIDVGTTSEPKLRLIETENMACEKYVALSHCWGDIPENLKFCTYRGNIDEHKRQMGFNRLPKNFQDTVTITRKLQIQYLWIDSICIIQKDKVDWEAEAGNMENVFSAAYCTIAASSAESSLVGILHERKPRPCVTVETPTGRLYFCKTIDNFHDDVEQSVLNSRGWVLQERALSQRTLHFTANQIYFECGQAVHCETLTKLRNPKSEFLGDAHFPRSALKYYKDGRQVLFHNLYSMYSKLAFRYPTDRSVGLFGLERRLARTFDTQADYGIFQGYLHRSLIWRRHESSAKMQRIQYPEDRIVPSWSWMAYTGPIMYVDPKFDTVEWNKKEVSDPFTAGPLRRSSRISQGKPPAEIEAVARQFDLAAFNAIERLKRCVFDVEETEDFGTLRCVIVGKDRDGPLDQRTCYVLIIRSVSAVESDTWIRAGVASLLPCHISLATEEWVRIQ